MSKAYANDDGTIEIESRSYQIANLQEREVMERIDSLPPCIREALFAIVEPRSRRQKYPSMEKLAQKNECDARILRNEGVAALSRLQSKFGEKND